MIARHSRRSVAAFLVVAAAPLAACSSSPPTEASPTPAASPAPASARASSSADPSATPVPSEHTSSEHTSSDAAERTPVPSDVALTIEQFVTGALDGELAARALDAQLAVERPGTFDATPDWALSRRRAVVLAVLHAPEPLRDELARLDEPAREQAAAEANADLESGKLARPLELADRYPTLPFADVVRAKVSEARAAGPHDVLDVSALASVLPAGPLAFGGISVRADGQDGLVAQDGDGNRVWEYRLPECARGDFHWLRVLGCASERIVALVIPHAGDPAVCVGIDATTGNELFRVELFPLARDESGHVETVDSALGAVEAVIACAGRVAVVDVRRGELAWRRRALASGRLSSVGAERVVLAAPGGEGPASELDLLTGRRPGPATSRPKAGSIQIR